ncbi:hypothetical protein LAZ67_13000574 [Cordylochernes scorpioides]|uniref:Uncharacterized protein n=1 Tax=Cordylochernes scorpioides TaxID=51811 RepID=A0ABY6L333_9ARAC|nr:hypothetical protein LAZ67_13000574 [Cordylochernes scorpioides]
MAAAGQQQLVAAMAGQPQINNQQIVQLVTTPNGQILAATTNLHISNVRGCIPNVDCGIRRSYLGPKQRLSVVQNDLKRLRRCERRRACRTPEHFNNRQKN